MFKPAFLGRLIIVPYYPIADDVMKQIIKLQLGRIGNRLRENHRAKFTYSDGQWFVTNLGMNGITLNGRAVTGEHAVSTGDSIRWGTRPDALLSEVQIG